MRTISRGACFFGVLAIVTACGASGSGSDACFDGTCSNGQPDGATFTAEAGPAACGDNQCNGAETCLSCPLDCGDCPACSLAPTCSNALGLPSHPTPRPDLYIGASAPDAGADAGVPNTLPGQDGCQNPQLRIRIANVLVHSGGGPIACIVDGNDGVTSEIATTPQTKDLADNETFAFDVGTSVFWGAKDLHTTTDNLTITYNCFVIVDNSAWSAALDALGKAAVSAGGVAGPYGWAFGAAGAAAQAGAAAINANNGAKLKLNAQQTIDKGELLDLTNGRTWQIRKSGGGLFDSWDWEIQVESWGCARGLPPQK